MQWSSSLFPVVYQCGLVLVILLRTVPRTLSPVQAGVVLEIGDQQAPVAQEINIKIPQRTLLYLSARGC